MVRRTHQAPPGWPAYLVDRAGRVGHALLADYFAAGCPAADTPIGEAPLVALDIETTGLDPRRHAIVSIGVVPFSLSRIPLREARYWVLKPYRELTATSVTFHHITHDEVANAPDLAEVLPEVLGVLKGRLAVVHYRHIERGFIDAAVQTRLGEELLFPVIDTMSLEARLHRQSPWARLRRWLGRPPVSIRLNASRERYGLPPYQGHHALIDALATAELLQAQVASRFSAETPVSELWS
ncbi:3'-5' exonuclease [Halomonas sp. SSL-5]|uniref:3'-5' exonuclease n=1 Tax=Halomonas sp. SSL-5 TaxID=3065855 RepID=UPI00273A2270|nr:3'-5' exonuclease [Halomonas sp. SSL-5]MDY7115507.1 3'-5' exonuclease [Halomonas sp. SSL-5]